MYQLEYKKAAVKVLAKMPSGIRLKMRDELKMVAENPNTYTGDWKALKGTEYWRLRVGSYRAICELIDDRLVMLVLKAGPRGDVYK